MAPIEAAVRAAIEEVAGPAAAALPPHSRLAEEMGIDSLDFVRLVQVIEERLALQLDDADLAPVRDLSGLLAVVAAAAG